MKLHSDPVSTQNLVTAYDSGYIEINQIRFTHAVVFSPDSAIVRWAVNTPQNITASLLCQAVGLSETATDPLAFLEAETAPAMPAADKPDVLLVGTGNTQCFLPTDVLQPLLKAGIGVEVMDTQAAARTYNILMSEGRRVVVALIPLGDPSA